MYTSFLTISKTEHRGTNKFKSIFYNCCIKEMDIIHIKEIILYTQGLKQHIKIFIFYFQKNQPQMCVII